MAAANNTTATSYRDLPLGPEAIRFIYEIVVERLQVTAKEGGDVSEIDPDQVMSLRLARRRLSLGNGTSAAYIPQHQSWSDDLAITTPY